MAVKLSAACKPSLSPEGAGNLAPILATMAKPRPAPHHRALFTTEPGLRDVHTTEGCS